MLEKVISGFQTGADIAGVRAAKRAGLATGGWMPKGFRTLDGPRPEYAEEFGAREHASPLYSERTGANVSAATATIRFATDWDSPGERCTSKWLFVHEKPFLDINPFARPHAEMVAGWIQGQRAFVLNIAGNSEKTSPGIERAVEKYLFKVFSIMKEKGWA